MSIKTFYPLFGELKRGMLLNYAERTSNLSVTATTEGTSQEVVSTNSFSYPNSEILIEFFSPNAGNPYTAQNLIILLYDDATILGQMVKIAGSANNIQSSLYGSYKLIPSLGMHTFKIKAIVSANQGEINAGAGGTGTLLPTFIKITAI
jgi:hypothetical protein